MSKPLKIVLCWVLICSGCAAPVLNKDKLLMDRVSQNPSVELQLLDIHLGMPYEKAKALLTQKYDRPIRFQSTPHTAVTFKLDSKTDNVITIIAKSDDPFAVGDVSVLGTEPIPGLNFFSNANLGDSEASIRFKFPKVQMEQRKDYRRYTIPSANYFLNVENGKVTTLGIWDRFTISVKGENDSIALSPNLAVIAAKQGWLAEKLVLSKPENMEKIKALVSDPLRPYCKERYPLRQEIIAGTAYIDVNVFKNKQEPPIPATFLLDTGWFVTAISPELCKKIDCKYVKPSSPEDEPDDPRKREISIGGIEFGNTRDVLGMFIITPPEFQLSFQRKGILGGTTLFAQPLFLNFKQGYLCFPTLPVSQVVQKLKYAKLSSEQQVAWIWTNFYANNQLLKFGELDSGAERTFLPKEDITRLKLRDLRKTIGYHSVRGLSRHPLYGPVEIGWPNLGVTQNLPSVAESGNGRSLIGIDFLRHTILSIEFESGNIYFGQ